MDTISSNQEETKIYATQGEGGDRGGRRKSTKTRDIDISEGRNSRFRKSEERGASCLYHRGKAPASQIRGDRTGGGRITPQQRKTTKNILEGDVIASSARHPVSKAEGDPVVFYYTE